MAGVAIGSDGTGVATEVQTIGISPSSGPVQIRTVLRCPNSSCKLIQFVASDRKCRRCKHPIDPPEERPEPVQIEPTDPQPSPADNPFTFDLNQSLSLVIYCLRNDRGLTQKQMAERLGVKRTYVSKIENGANMPTIKIVAKIADALKVDMARMMLMCEYLQDGKLGGYSS